MKKILTIIVFFIGVMKMVEAKENITPIRASINADYLFCDVKINDVSSFDNRDEVIFEQGNIASNTNVQILSKKGMNSISIEVGSLDWFNPKNSTSDRKYEFDKRAYCYIDIYKVDTNTGKNNTISKIQIKIDNDGLPQAFTSNTLDESVVREDVYADNTEKVIKNRIRYSVGENEYPENMALTKFTKKIMLDNIPHWKWEGSEVYDNKKINELKYAYQELWNAFESKNISEIKKINKVSNDSWAISVNSTEDNIFNSYDIAEILNAPSLKMIPIDWDNFKIVTMNDNKMVKFVYKEDFAYSPITMSYNDGEEEVLYSFSPIFSFVDGKFIPVI